MIHMIRPTSSLCGDVGTLTNHKDMVECKLCKLILQQLMEKKDADNKEV